MYLKRLSLGALLLIFALFSALQAHAQEDNLTTAMNELAQKLKPEDSVLAQVLKSLGPEAPAKIAIAVADPEGPGNQLSRFSEAVVDTLTTALVNQKFASVLARRRLNQILDQQQIELSSIIDSKTRAPLRKKLSLHALVFLKIKEETFHLNVLGSLVDIATADTLTSYEVKVPKNQRIRTMLKTMLTANLTIKANPAPRRAVVEVGSRKISLTPTGASFRNLPQGRHKLFIQAPCLDPYSLTVDLNRDRVVELTLEPKKATLQLLVIPNNAQVTIDGFSRGFQPDSSGQVTVPLDEGKHQIRVMSPEHDPLDQEVNLSCGQNKALTIDLTKQSLPLSVKVSPPTARVVLNRIPLGLDDKGVASLEVNRGKQTITVSAPGYLPFEKTFEMNKAEELKIDLQREPVQVEFSGIFGDPMRPDDRHQLINGAMIQSGWYYAIAIKSNKKAWVYVYQLDSMGKVSRLFPRPSFPGLTNPIEPDKWIWSPPEDYRSVLDNNVGKEMIFMVASPEKDAKLEAIQRKLEDLKSKPALLASATRVLMNEFAKRGEARVHRVGQHQMKFGDGYFQSARQLLEASGKVFVLEFNHVR